MLHIVDCAIHNRRSSWDHFYDGDEGLDGGDVGGSPRYEMHKMDHHDPGWMGFSETFLFFIYSNVHMVEGLNSSLWTESSSRAFVTSMLQPGFEEMTEEHIVNWKC